MSNSTKGLNLAQAVQSGKPFRRESWIDGDLWIVLGDGNFHDVKFKGLSSYTTMLIDADWFLTSDWEIQEKEVTITASQFWVAVATVMKQIEGDCIVYPNYRSGVTTRLAQLLGLDEGE